MWEWSRAVAERAAAAAWTRRDREPEPTVLDPEDWRKTDGDGTEGDMVAYLGHRAYCLIG
ncbi:hypothetical protein [Nocardia transvalensis]|uniref:hypothetical protein n=1 Tax=Nocardia transvalensis TaxID=37333 RepID=UPI001894FF4F|nr:hypothetical protein [Nocardia transvalensis]MBF6334041.1 hypothetical protein [Nocardia transvalensis]